MHVRFFNRTTALTTLFRNELPSYNVQYICYSKIWTKIPEGGKTVFWPVELVNNIHRILAHLNMLHQELALVVQICQTVTPIQNKSPSLYRLWKLPTKSYLQCLIPSSTPNGFHILSTSEGPYWVDPGCYTTYVYRIGTDRSGNARLPREIGNLGIFVSMVWLDIWPNRVVSYIKNFLFSWATKWMNLFSTFRGKISIFPY
jgi:hypothetical protein